MKHKTLHMIGNAHLDVVWLWRWQEGLQAAKATFRAMLQQLGESADFVFTSSSAAIYAWIESNDPEMFAAIKQRVVEGRWCIVGGWWLQPDCNLPCGEAFVRHALYGQRFFKEKLGVVATVGYNVDSFGHHAMLPQILLKSGLTSYVFTRPETFEKGLPGRVFWWESDDGSRVLAYRIPYEYLSRDADLQTYVRRCMPELKAPLDDLMCFYGVGNHGGGPTRANLASIRRMDADPEFPHLVFDSPEGFFNTVRASGQRFPVVHDELQHHASGCYAAHSGVKRWNRQAEHLLLTAERLSVLAAHLVNQPYPSELTHAWQNVLFNQFHDILAGTSLPEAYDDARDLYGEALSIGNRALNDALQRLASNIALPFEAGMTPIVVFNPHAWPATVPVEVDYGGLTPQMRLVDDTNRELSFQFIRPSVVVSGWRKRMSFVADLPALGYRVFRMRKEPSQLEVAAVAASDYMIETDWFRLEIDPTTGSIVSLHDKRWHVEVFAGPAAVPVVIEDRSDTWSHGVYHFQDVIGAFTATDVCLVEQGPVQATIRVQSRYGASHITQYFTLYRDLPYITVRVQVDWHEQLKLLKLRFPVNLHFVKATYEIPYGSIERPATGEEEPGLNWLDVSGIERSTEIPYGLSLLNDGKYSFDVRGNELSMTILRSPPYAHHVPRQLVPEEDYTFMDQGIQWFTYALLPHDRSWETAGTVQHALELNQPVVTLVESAHDGPLPQQASYIAVDRPNIVVSVLKQAEDDDSTILRCYETAKMATEATFHLSLWGRELTTHFDPCEIKTFRVPRDHDTPITEVNLIEWAYEAVGSELFDGQSIQQEGSNSHGGKA
ncbi:MAG: alpha-mannosidase [Herpetosiphonaceae bacterium]|nr:alpha-mannosidase [Herpetosiphonaceae bacterium]